jgi:hypothetical protein
MFRHYIATFRERFLCLLRNAQLRSRRYNIVDGCVVSSDVVRGDLTSQIATNHVTKHNTPIHNILSTDPHLSISQKALETLPEDDYAMPKHLGVIIHKKLLKNCCIFCFLRTFLLGILIFKRLIARRLYKSFGVKGLILYPALGRNKVYILKRNNGQILFLLVVM